MESNIEENDSASHNSPPSQGGSPLPMEEVGPASERMRIRSDNAIDLHERVERERERGF